MFKSSLKQDFKFHIDFVSFEMAPNNFEFDFEQIYFNLSKSPNGKIFRDNRDPDLNYFDEINIPSKETTYINETDMKNVLYDTQRFGNVSVLHVNSGRLKTDFGNLRGLSIKKGRTCCFLPLTSFLRI